MQMEEAILQAIHDAPDESASWLVLTDWLEENGHAERAELMRLHHRLRQPGLIPGRDGLEKRARSLLLGGVRPSVPTLVNSVGMTLVLVPPGTFLMGSPDPDPRQGGSHADERPQHPVTLSRAFYLGRCEVTQGQFEQIMNANHSRFRPGGDGAQRVEGIDTRVLPAENISYNDATEFCRRLSALAAEKEAGRSYRLPSEAEWEYACRAGAWLSHYHFGNRLIKKQANFGWNPPNLGRTTAVGSYAPNLFGLHDMHGNVWEWCADWYSPGYYQSSPKVDPPGPRRGERRVIRGGGWSTSADLCRAALRGHNTPDARHEYNGFRVAMTRSRK
jgi:uncharacterized protein (TIGR02996 family)